MSQTIHVMIESLIQPCVFRHRENTCRASVRSLPGSSVTEPADFGERTPLSSLRPSLIRVVDRLCSVIKLNEARQDYTQRNMNVRLRRLQRPKRWKGFRLLSTDGRTTANLRASLSFNGNSCLGLLRQSDTFPYFKSPFPNTDKTHLPIPFVLASCIAHRTMQG